MGKKLLRPFTGTGAVFFPIGPPPLGTCEFATDSCRKHCYVNDTSDFDQETRISEIDKQEIYKAIVTWSVEFIIETFLRDLDGLQTPILHWFGSGDCLNKDIERISDIIRAIPACIVQMGFTRNRTLWELHKNIFALSIEHKHEATDPLAMYAIPDYDLETSVMYVPTYNVRGGYCGPYLCKDHYRNNPELTHYINCQICHRLKTGCFDRRF